MDPQRIVDNNPLLTTLAAVSGGTAAILGGFVLSTIIDLAAERGRLAQIVNDLEAKQREDRQRIESLERLQRIHLENQVFDLLVMQFAQDRHRPRFEQCRTLILSLATVQIENVDVIVQKYLSERDEAEAFVDRAFENFEPGEHSPEFREFLLNYPAGELNTTLVHQSYIRAIDERIRLANFARAIDSVQKPISHPETFESLPTITPDTAFQKRNREIEELRNRVEQEAMVLRDRRAEYAASSLPRFVGFGALVFAYQAVMCVILPMSFVGSHSETLSSTSLRWLRVLFDGQFIAIFAYVILLIRPFLRQSK